MVDFSKYQTIRVDRRDRILTLTLSRPEKLNAVDEALHGELATIFADAADDPDSDVIMLTGEGRAFSSGGDILWRQEMIDRRFAHTAGEAKRIVFSLLDCEKPVIAKVNGHATGLGATLALFCDVIFAADHAKIGAPHANVGLTAGDGGAVIWPQLSGDARAKEFLMTGHSRSAGGRSARRDPHQQGFGQYRTETIGRRDHGRLPRFRAAVQCVSGSSRGGRSVSRRP